MKNYYYRNKEKLRQEAMNFQNTFANGQAYYYSELAEITNNLYARAKKYGLVKELKEEGII